eukprot:TRINITY_DN1529_c0_g1_i1.p1 TRINITY_DN1529_c0_g1~~TRINITY_DN1529_c0_g1_i1.p1  ORF type:complete len:430 (+),score=58.89 TRINITY_DN1529_c0_g1_i1:36-1292(+)
MLTSAGAITCAVLSGGTKGVSALSLFCRPWFLVLISAAAVERLAGLATGVAFERDWVVQLAGPSRPIALAAANAVLRRVDLFCEIAGPLTFGWLLSNYDTFTCIKAAALICLISMPLLILLASLTDYFSAGVLRRPRHATPPGKSAEASHPSSSPSDSNRKAQQHTSNPQPTSVPNGLTAALKGWRQYLAQPVLPASIAYVLLYFNAVLSPGSLMTSFLTQRGLNMSIIGIFRGASAAMGFLATFVSTPLIARIGVLQAGAAALVFKSLVLILSVLLYLFSPAGNHGALMLFLGLVVLSRLGYWTYDVVDAQIFQTAIPTAQANLVGTTEVALASLAELIMLGGAIVMHDVSHFGTLAIMSASSVLCATLIYCHWLANPNADQKRLFPSNPKHPLSRFLGGKGHQEPSHPGVQPLIQM